MTNFQKHRLLTLVYLCLGLGLSSASHASDDWDACAMLKKANVEMAFAPLKFDNGSPGKNPIKGNAKMSSVSTCTYVSKGATAKDTVSVSLLANRAPSDAYGMTSEKAKAGALHLKATPVDMASLGGGAYWINMGSSKRPSIQLNVFQRKREWLIYGASGLKLDQATALAGLEKLAKAAQ